MDNEVLAYKKGWAVGTLDAFDKQVGPPDSNERLAFWQGVFDRAQYELKRLPKKIEGD